MGDTTTEWGGMYDYGSIVPANISIADGNITTTSAGKVWSVRISVPNALNIGLMFTQFNLSSTAEMYIYNDAKTTLDSAIKKQYFTNSDTLYTSSIKGNSIIVYIIEPNNFGTFLSNLTIGSIVAGYREIQDVGEINSSQYRHTNCMPHVMCYPGHMGSARAVARIFIPVVGNLFSQCTGTLINNEENNGRAYLLTAFHCIDNGTNGLPGSLPNGIIDQEELVALRRAFFEFQAWRTLCDGNIINRFITFNGAVLRSSNRSTDMVLLELIDQPGIGDGINYAGWSRQTTLPNSTLSYILHHPDGEDMRHTQTQNVNHFLVNNDYWQAYYSAGAVTRGSSGSALFNEYNQVIGQLKGGWSSCTFSGFSDRYGKFSRSWSVSNLQQWLSPTQSLQSVGTLNLSSLEIQGSITVPCAEQSQYSVPNVLDANYLWTVSNNLQIVNGQGTSTITVTGIGSGIGTITLIINTPTKGTFPTGRTLTVSKQITIGSYFPATINGPDNAIANSGYYFSLNIPFNVTVSNINWRVPTGWTISAGQGTRYVTIWTGSSTGDVEVDFDACGVTRSIFKNVIIGDGGDIQPLRNEGGVIVYPNPASDMIIVTLNESNVKTNTRFIKQIKITSKTGLTLINIKYNDKGQSRQVNIASLQPDIYTIEVYDNKTWQSVKLSKQ